MRFDQLIRACAQRTGISIESCKYVVQGFFDEMVHQLALSEEVRIPGLGRFQTVIWKMPPNVCNLPNVKSLKGKRVQARVRRRVKFVQYKSTRDRLEKCSALRTLSGQADCQYVAEIREGKIRMGKKKQKTLTIDVPPGVKTIKIQFEGDEAPTKTKEDKKKARLLG